MTEPRLFPFGGVPVYNPQSLSRTEAIAQFHVREATYSSLLDLLREERPSHVLVIGARGMGKTTLLQRVRYGVEDDPDLNSRYMALVFPEEQYNVNRLHHFLLNTVDALADAMERDKDTRMLKRVEEFAGMIGTCTPEQVEDRVPQFLEQINREIQKSILLLVDNADRLFDTIESVQQWRFRELLSTRRDLTFFGATTQASEGIYGPDRAFFEFFKIYQLAPLTLTEVKDLLLRLSESVEENENEKGAAKQRVADWLNADPARLQTLVQLTGGNPRTTVLLFHLVLDGLAGGAREYLEQLLDQVTPTYKGRVDELPPQAQQVLDAVALRWDPVTAMEVHDDTGLDTSAVSTQLTRLVRQGVLEKADPGDSKKAMYQVAERFFNIWYLMRASRRVRAKLRWFVEFLRVFFDSSELERMAWERIEHHQGARRRRPEEIETFFAYILASGAQPDMFEHYLRQKCSDIEDMWRPYLATMDTKSADDGSAVPGSVQTETGLRAQMLMNWLFKRRAPKRGTHAEAEAASRKAICLHPDSASGSNLGILPTKTSGRIEEAEGASALSYIPETTLLKAIELDPNDVSSWGFLITVLINRPERADEAERVSRKATEVHPNVAVFWGSLGTVLARKPERAEEAELAVRKAIQLDPDFAWFWAILGTLLRRKPDEIDEAEKAFRKAIELDPNIAMFWSALGVVVAARPERTKEAELAHRKAVELGPKIAWVWGHFAAFLANTPGRSEEAESAVRKAIELDSNSAALWCMLGSLISRNSERAQEAESTFRKAAELDAKNALTWIWLGTLLETMPERTGDAESVYRKAIELDPENAAFWAGLGVFLACRAAKPSDAEVALSKSVQLEPNNAVNVRILGVLLYCELSTPQEARRHLRRAHELDPDNRVSAAIFAAALERSETAQKELLISIDAARDPAFWDELLMLCRNYPPFGKLLLGICDLVQEKDALNRYAGLYRAVALAQLHDFPRASVALEDALNGDPIDLYSIGQNALETFFAAAVKNGRVRDCLELIDRRGWRDAWRPIYEALQALEAGSADHLKRVAVEIRDPSFVILRRISPQLPDLPEIQASMSPASHASVRS